MVMSFSQLWASLRGRRRSCPDSARDEIDELRRQSSELSASVERIEARAAASIVKPPKATKADDS